MPLHNFIEFYYLEAIRSHINTDLKREQSHIYLQLHTHFILFFYK